MILSLLAGAALASPSLDCGTPALLTGAPTHPAMTEMPDALGGRAIPPPSPDREIYGTPYDEHIETEHFTLNKASSSISDDALTRAGEALETAWSSYVDDLDWPAPVSSDAFYIWVILDTSLGTTTGYTTEYATPQYPGGVPVIYLNPTYADDTRFWAMLSAHEFMHAIQFAMRDWDGSDASQAWYWEASANHACELADPDVDGHQYGSVWYSEQTELSYDSMTGSHQYGMFVLNAWLDERSPGFMQQVWEASTDRPGDTWDALIADTADTEVDLIWGGFTGAYGNEELEESELFEAANTVGDLVDGRYGEVAYLGSEYFDVTEDATVEVEGNAVLGAANGEWGSVVQVRVGELVAVTGLEEDASYRLSVGEPGADPGDEDDTGAGANGDRDTGKWGGAGGGGSLIGDDPKTCGCAGAPGVVGLGWVLGLGLLTRRRR